MSSCGRLTGVAMIAVARRTAVKKVLKNMIRIGKL